MTDTSTTYTISSETRDQLTDLLEAVANGDVGYRLIKSAAAILPHIKGAPAADIEVAMDNILADVGLPTPTPEADRLARHGRAGRWVEPPAWHKHYFGASGACLDSRCAVTNSDLGADAPAGAGHSVEAERG